MERQTIIILDLGGPNNQLIARRVRECNVYCELLPHDADAQTIKNLNPAGIIIAGSFSNDNKLFNLDQNIFKIGIPVLGIGLGQLIILKTLGGNASVKA